MKKNLWLFLFGGLALSLLLATLFSPFASSMPDGLEKVAQDKGFLEKGEGDPVWRFAPVPDYTLPGMSHESAATGAAGFIGTAFVFGAGWIISRVLRFKHDAQPSPGESHEA